jgi:hypothetical protein
MDILVTGAYGFIPEGSGQYPGGYGYGPVNKLPAPDRGTTMGRSLTGQLAFTELAAATEGIDAMDHMFAVTESEVLEKILFCLRLFSEPLVRYQH